MNKLSAANIEELKKMPETGMGYHLITATLDYTTREYIVLNSQFAFDLKYGIDEEIKIFIQGGNDFVFNNLSVIDLKISKFKIISLL